MAHFGGSKGSARRGVPLPMMLLVVASVAHCGGRSARVESDGDDGASAASGDGGATTGGANPMGGVSAGGATGGITTGGITTGGVATGGSAGDPLDPDVRCRLPVSFGACRTRSEDFWFDASTGLCLPFDYYGCSGNENRFASAEECYAVCSGRGDHELARCETSAECHAKRLAEPCCRLDVREFVGINRGNDFTCMHPEICPSCAADCDYVPPDGYIGASCVAGHCIAFDVRDVAPQLCMTSADCYLRYGVECCPDCRPEQSPSKLVALSSRFDIATLACGEGMSCIDTCVYDGATANCSASNECEALIHPL